MREADVLATARQIAEEVLFPRALETDAASLVAVSNLDALAEAGLYGMAAPAEAGGLALDLGAAGQVIEALAGGCLTTTFVWLQHQGAVRAVAAADSAELRRRWLGALCRGERRAAIALGGIRPGQAGLRAEPVSDGWSLTGSVPWVTGWGRVDVVYAGALIDDGTVLWALIDLGAGAAAAGSPPTRSATPTLTARLLPLVAAGASGTVELGFDHHLVPADAVVAIEPRRSAPAHDGGGRLNGSLALGVTGRCCALLGPSDLDGELAACRRGLDTASEHTMAAARAMASELALRSATTLAAATGSSSVLLDSHVQRLVREALFLLVFGSRPAIRSALVDLLPRPPGQRRRSASRAAM